MKRIQCRRPFRTNIIKAALLSFATTMAEAELVAAPMGIRTNSPAGQIEIVEGPKRVLQYIYQTMEPGDITNKVSAGNRKYAVARSDYLHPLYDLEDKSLTKDWSLDHPHHRGIYWAWPEVRYKQELGDLHALQKVFARPTGKLKTAVGESFVEIEAENLWHWDDQEAVVRETAVIRAHRATAEGRWIDLTFEFTALKDGVTVARRGTKLYGGLNLRLNKLQERQIQVHADPAGVLPRRAYSDLSGFLPGADKPCGLAVLQHRMNPDYPGDWVQYPDLDWVQPTFPAAGRRYPLSRTKPLTLRYRLWIHQGRVASEALARQWDEYHATETKN